MQLVGCCSPVFLDFVRNKGNGCAIRSVIVIRYALLVFDNYVPILIIRMVYAGSVCEDHNELKIDSITMSIVSQSCSGVIDQMVISCP